MTKRGSGACFRAGFLVLLLTAAFCMAVGETPGNGEKLSPIRPEEEELIRHYREPEWLMDAKFGAFIVWGPTTHAIRESETAMGWYGRGMYRKGSPMHAYHLKHYGDPDTVGYKDVIEGFKAPKFDAGEWVDLCVRAGVRYVGPIAIFHDNFLMYDSDVSSWNSVRRGPGKDVCGALAAECRKRGLKFAGTFHHGFTYRFYDGAHEYDGKEAVELYGPPRQALPRGHEDYKKIPREFQEGFLARVNEFVTRYRPDMIYFDFGLGWHDADIQNRLFSHFYNSAREYGQSRPTVAQKQRNGNVLKYSTLDLERGRMPFLTDYHWQTDTSPGPWFHHKNPSLETSNNMIDMLIDIVSKNGTLFLCLAPDHLGGIPDGFRRIFEDMGDWLSVHGEGIYGTRPWATFGEGPTDGGEGHHKAANSFAKKEATYQARDVRFTRSRDGKTLYVFALDIPESRRLSPLSLVVEPPRDGATVELMGHGRVPYRVSEGGRMTIDFSGVPQDELNPNALGFRLTGFEPSWHLDGHYCLPTTVVSSPEKAVVVRGVEKEAVDGRTVLTSWAPEAEVKWPLAMKYGRYAARSFEMGCRIDNPVAGGKLLVTLVDSKGGKKASFTRDLPSTRGEEIVSLGTFDSRGIGDHTVVLTAEGVGPGAVLFELMISIRRDRTVLKIGESWF